MSPPPGEPLEIADDIVVIGLPLRTSPATAMQDIPAFWSRFMKEDAPVARLRRDDDTFVYGVYCDYESDFRGPYTLVAGYAVTAAQEVPPGLRRVRIPKGRYARFVAKGDPSKVIAQTWQHINGNWPERDRRRYIADFERYGPNARTDGGISAEVLVGLI